jgi:glutamyl-tRNA reductase
MLDGYHILTLTHRHASLETIGRAVVRSDAHHDSSATLHRLKEHFGWSELLYLATCNRVMYLFYAPQLQTSNSELQTSNFKLQTTLLSLIRPELSDNEIDDIASRMQLLRGPDAVRHLMEVAASMDSLVVGEREIIRQLREAWERSHAWGLTGDHLRLLTRFTIETAKEIYTHTGIGQKALSIVGLAFGQMQRAGLPLDARILLVGAGQTNALFAKFLLKHGYRRVTVFNRTEAKAAALAADFEGRGLPLDTLPHYSEGFDALVVCTGATQPVVTPDLYRNLLAGESDRKIVIDLSVPNNVDRRVPEQFFTQFIEIEGLREAAQANLAHRERERGKAEGHIARRIAAFRECWHERQVERSLAHVPDEVRAVKERAIQSVYAKEFAQLDPAAQDLVQRMMGYMEKKCVAIPMKAAKAIALNGMRKTMAREVSIEA